ncbi:replication endonuclease [Aliarcobacter butzleri]|uniref:replication endonuclease n=1 Tax=Aliarcobacter butzleri TaxID=28197 RepID=UPI00214BBC1D|nr:replication endonuclease [Aliarcobacter butzleri]MCP3649694.1 replication endonuclease [Arcobacter sp. DNRA7]MCR1815867.1 replication endonuclease [Aliarcobacter butzleri]
MLKVKPFLKTNETLNNSFLKKEYENLINVKYEKVSERKEKKTNDYLDKCVLKNTLTDELIKIKKDVVKDFNETKNLTYLKCKELNRENETEENEVIMITLTNPSNFHPFVFDKEKQEFKRLNKNFNFKNLETRIDESYININKIFREFYKNVKKRENKEMKFIKIVEPHSSLICHIHRILYIKKGTYLKVKEQFNRIKLKHELKECDISRLKNRKGSSYIIKYLLKNYKSEDIKKFDGYKKLHKIRIFTMSNLNLSSSIFKKLYYTNKELNLKIMEDIKNGSSIYNNLYHFYTLNTTVKVVNEDEKTLKTLNYEDKKRFLVYKKIKKNVRIEEKKVLNYKHREINQETLKNFKNKEVNFIVKESIKDYITNNYIYLINLITTVTEKNEVETTQVLEFKIYDTEKQKEIYNNKNFILIRMV